MAIVNDFEKATDTRGKLTPKTFQEQFSHESNVHYRANSADELLSDLTELEAFIQHFYEHQVPRLEVLDRYTKARNTTIYTEDRRRQEPNKSDHRACHNFAKIINVFDVGYNTGVPIKKESDDNKIHDIIADFDDLNDIENLDAELWRDVSKFGRAYELQFRSQTDQDRIVISSVFETFVIYSLDVERTPIMALRLQKYTEKQQEKVKITAYTDREVINFRPSNSTVVKLVEESREAHSFGEVPITEYSSDRYRQGAYEDIISLIDLYDSAQSDTANYMTDFNDSLLVISGNLGADSADIEELEKMRNANMLLLEDTPSSDGKISHATAEYIYKQYDVNGAEAYKKRLRDDIHAISFVPDLTDQSFSGTQSGEAMKYKLFGFQQSVKTRQSTFKKGLMRRYRLLLNIKKSVQEADNCDLALKITFTANLPKAVLEELKTLNSAGAEFSQETILSLASFVEDAKDEIEKFKKEREGELHSFNPFSPLADEHDHATDEPEESN